MTADDLGPLLGAIPVGLMWLAREWWKARSSQRTDAVESANAHAQRDMLADLERRAKEAEADADKERAERLISERVSTSAVADLRSAQRVIRLMDRKLKQAGVSDSERDALLTDFGNFNQKHE